MIDGMTVLDYAPVNMVRQTDEEQRADQLFLIRQNYNIALFHSFFVKISMRD
jgi:hypothetical protein